MKRGVSVTKGLADLADGLAELKNSLSNLTINDSPLQQATHVEEEPKQSTTEEMTTLNLEQIVVSFNDPESCLGFLTHPQISLMLGPVEIQKMVAALQTYLESYTFRPPAFLDIGHTLARNPQWCQWLSYSYFIPFMSEDQKLREYIVSSADFLMHLDHKQISDIAVNFPANATTLLNTLFQVLKSKTATSREFKLTILSLQWIEERAPFTWANSGIYDELDGYIAKHSNKDVKVFIVPKTYTPLRTAKDSVRKDLLEVEVQGGALLEPLNPKLNPKALV